jgi:hypothetical protein
MKEQRNTNKRVTGIVHDVGMTRQILILDIPALAQLEAT